MVMPLSRRRFLTASAAAAACKNTAEPAQAPAPPDAATTAREAGLEQAIAQAERLLGVKHTAEERAMLVDTLEEQLARTLALRGHNPPNGLAPATVFDPRVPGFEMPRAPRTRPSRPRGALPGKDEDIAFAPVPLLGHWLVSKKITSKRLTELYLSRLEAHGSTLECVVTLTRERALEEATRADEELARGRGRGPLHGIPYGAKDLFDTAGIRTTWGAGPYRDRVARTDAAVVHRLHEAGAVLVAKLSLGALAYGDLWFDGLTRNPWNLAEGSSGSSAGSAAATAAGLVGFSLGTETLGSIVSPSMRCGTTGLRPTFGRVPRTGAMALCWSMDKVGPICRTVEGCATVLDAITGPDAGDPGTIDAPYGYDMRAGIDGLRVGYDEKWFEGDDAALDREALKIIEQGGASLVPVTLPELPWEGMMAILFAEAAAAFESITLDGRDDELAWQASNAWPNAFRAARFISAVELVQAQRLRRAAMDALHRSLAGVDAVISPSFAGPMLVITNYTGHPSLTLRIGFRDQAARPFHGTGEGLPRKAPTKAELAAKKRVPHGMTLWGQPFREDVLVRLGAHLEGELGVWSERPPLS